MKGLDKILLAHGGGGKLTAQLVREAFLPLLDNPALAALSDAAVLPGLPPGRPALTTDAFVVEPPVFPGGDLGYLSVCGTVNDLAVSGATPLWLTFALILEEGLDGALLQTFIEGAARAAKEAGVSIVAGDTKVVPKGKGDRAFAITAGLGVVPPGLDLGDQHVRAGDRLLVSGPIAEHGTTVVACRHGMAGSGLRSDCQPLGSLVQALLDSGVALRAMHDPTRGGVATTCNEVALKCGLRCVLQEDAVPVSNEVAAVCDLLGLDPLYVACEGRLLAWVAPENAERALQVVRSHPMGAGAALIGRMEEASPGSAPVVLSTRFGSQRPLDYLSGSDVPRIC
jgi:hydrogenase expression/formation protein HypE